METINDVIVRLPIGDIKYPKEKPIEFPGISFDPRPVRSALILWHPNITLAQLD